MAKHMFHPKFELRYALSLALERAKPLYSRELWVALFAKGTNGDRVLYGTQVTIELKI